MKKGLTILLLLLICHSVYGQKVQNHLNIDPFVVFFGTYQVQYERSIKKDLSLSLTVGYKSSSGVLQLPGINFASFSTDDFDFQGIKLVPEFRWYVQDHDQGLYGFYVGSYVKYQNSSEDISGIYTDVNNEEFPIRMDTDVQSWSFGVEVGYKLKIKSRCFIDFIIAGPGINHVSFKLKEKVPVPDAFYDDLSDALERYGFFDLINTDFQIKPNQESSITLPALRYGIKFGYAF